MPWKARAVWDYEAKEDGELSFGVGDEIIILEERRNGWWKGQLRGEVGEFPVNYCDVEEGPGVGQSSLATETGVRIDQERISGGILALQRRCGFRYDTTEEEGSEEKITPRGLTSFEELQQKLGIQAFNPLEGVLKEVVGALPPSSSSSTSSQSGPTTEQEEAASDEEESRQDEEGPDSLVEVSSDFLSSSQEISLSRRKRISLAADEPGAVLASTKGEEKDKKSKNKRENRGSKEAKGSGEGQGRKDKGGRDNRSRMEDKTKARNAKGFGAQGGIGRRSMSDFRLTREDDGVKEKTKKSPNKKKEDTLPSSQREDASGGETPVATPRSLRFALPDEDPAHAEPPAAADDHSKATGGKPLSSAKEGSNSPAPLRHRKSKSQNNATWVIDPGVQKAAETRWPEEDAGISLRELMGAAGRRSAEGSAASAIAHVADRRSSREDSVESGGKVGGSPLPTKGATLNSLTASKVSKRWAKKLTQLGGRGDALQQVQRLLLAQSHGTGSPIFGKALREIIRDMEVAQKSEDLDCIINIFATMIVLQEAYQKQTDSIVEIANKKLAENEKELSEERSKNQGLVRQEKDLLKLLQQTQEKVMEKSKSSSRAENNKQNYKQKLDDEVERSQALEKELKKHKKVAEKRDKEIARLESELAKAKGKEAKRKNSLLSKKATRSGGGYPTPAAGHDKQVSQTALHLAPSEWDLGDGENPAA